MAFTVWGSFDAFSKSFVDLDTNDTKRARNSRDFLISQLLNLSKTVDGFPTLTGTSLSFGSFARKTKIQPLDDVDLIILLNAQGTSEYTLSGSNSYSRWLSMEDKTKSLGRFLDAYGYVNSTRVLNKIRDSLPKVSQYNKAEIKKTQQAVTVNLKSYPWVFDVVPAVAVSGLGGTGTSHYLIPDGSGEWIRTDPRIDSNNMTVANTRHQGRLLSVMRLLKYWNNRT